MLVDQKKKRPPPSAVEQTEAEAWSHFCQNEQRRMECVLVVQKKKRPPPSAVEQGRRPLVFVVVSRPRGSDPRRALYESYISCEAASHVERGKEGEQHMEFHGGLPPKY